MTENEQKIVDKLGSMKVFAEIRAQADARWMFKSNDRLGYINYCALAAFELVCVRNGLNDTGHLNYWLSKDRIIKTVISIYLQSWLTSDQKAGQNLNAFYEYGYHLKTGRKMRDCVDRETADVCYSQPTLVRQKKKIEEIDELRTEQAKSEHTYYKKDGKKTEENQPQTYGSKLPWQRLVVLQKMSEGKLQIISDLLENKILLGKGPLKDRNQRLHDCYQNYYELYQGLDPNCKGKRDISNVEYVVTAMMLQNIETSYRFHAAALLAKEVKCQYPAFSFEHYKNELLLFFGRFATADGVKQTIINNDKNLVFEYTSHDILSYLDEIQYLCNCEKQGGISDPVFFERKKATIILERETLAVLFNIIPPCEMPSWQETDYCSVRHFFEEEYPLYQIYQQACRKDGKLDMGDIIHKRKFDTAYDHIRAFLRWIMETSRSEANGNVNALGLDNASDKLLHFRKKQREPKHNRRGRPPKGDKQSN